MIAVIVRASVLSHGTVVKQSVVAVKALQATMS